MAHYWHWKQSAGLINTLNLCKLVLLLRIWRWKLLFIKKKKIEQTLFYLLIPLIEIFSTNSIWISFSNVWYSNPSQTPNNVAIINLINFTKIAGTYIHTYKYIKIKIPRIIFDAFAIYYGLQIIFISSVSTTKKLFSF